MRRLIMFGTMAIGFAFGATLADAANPNVPSWSPYAMMESGGAAPTMTRPPLTERRAAYVGDNPERYTLHNPEGPLNDYYRKSGLSDRSEDCASYGCAGGSRGN
jgi:hypothetical protein